jgi:hypothetical protein
MKRFNIVISNIRAHKNERRKNFTSDFPARNVDNKTEFSTFSSEEVKAAGPVAAI